MLTALLITLLPTLLASILLTKVGLKPKSKLLELTLSWFTGMYFITIGCFILSVFFTYFTDNVLMKATYAMLLIVQVILFFVIKDVHHTLISLKHDIFPITQRKLINIMLIAFCALFSYYFFAHHLTYNNNQLYTTQIYWDFHWHAALINNFAFGDNFPPENEAFSGLPHTYHYFWGVIGAIYEVAGLNLAVAVNVVSILAFSFLLIGLIGLSEELFKSRVAGFIAVILTLTNSSIHFIFYFASRKDESLSQIIQGILTTTEHPWYASFLPGNGLGYNGTMINLFYFLEERQLIFAVVFLLLSIWILHKREELSDKVLFWTGIAMGAYFLWHLYISISVLCAMLFLLAFGKHRKKTALLLGGFLLIFGAHYLYFKSVMRSEWFTSKIEEFPRFNTDFGGGEKRPFLLNNFLFSYFISYGAKILFMVLGLYVLFRNNRKVFLVLTAVILPTFILLNTVQLSPSSIYENHKWFRPLNVILDLAAAFILFTFFFSDRSFLKKAFGMLWIFFLTISGIIELMPFLNTQPTQLYADYPSSISKAVQEYSPPHSSFIGRDKREINLAGRKVFLGNNLGGDMAFKKDERGQIILDIYKAKNLTEFCSLTQKYKIDFFEIDKDSFSPLKEMAPSLPHFTAIAPGNEQVYFIDVKKSCR